MRISQYSYGALGFELPDRTEIGVCTRESEVSRECPTPCVLRACCLPTFRAKDDSWQSHIATRGCGEGIKFQLTRISSRDPL